jgi:hypothetical protein
MIPDTPSIEQLSDLLADRTSTREPSVSSDTLFSILSHRHRRYALAYLLEREGPVAVESLVSHVADRIDCEDGRDRIALQFHHNHLPKLANARLIEYDRNERIVARTDAAAAVSPHLELVAA